ncbi:MAG: hypothetical protein IPG47_04550 [Thermoflexaceae bacterium]|nr:hypothetical protein [Thermoflexaceae bacterium]
MVRVIGKPETYFLVPWAEDIVGRIHPIGKGDCLVIEQGLQQRFEEEPCFFGCQ